MLVEVAEAGWALMLVLCALIGLREVSEGRRLLGFVLLGNVGLTAAFRAAGFV